MSVATADISLYVSVSVEASATIVQVLLTNRTVLGLAQIRFRASRLADLRRKPNESGRQWQEH